MYVRGRDDAIAEDAMRKSMPQSARDAAGVVCTVAGRDSRGEAAGATAGGLTMALSTWFQTSSEL